MLLKYAEANVFNTSGAHNTNTNTREVRYVLRIKNIGLHIILKHWPHMFI